MTETRPTNRISEWLSTDGQGGFICGTTSGEIARFWHGWWIATEPPRARKQLMLGWEEELLLGQDRREFTSAHWNEEKWVQPKGNIVVSDSRRHYLGDGFSLTRDAAVAPVNDHAMVLAYTLQEESPAPGRTLSFRPHFPEPIETINVQDGNIELVFESGTSVFVATTGTMRVRELDPQPIEISLEIEKDCSDETTCESHRPVEFQFDFPEESSEGLALLISTTQLPAEPSELAALRLKFVPTAFAGLFATNGKNFFDLSRDDISEDSSEEEVRWYHQQPDSIGHAAQQFLVKTMSGKTTILAGYPWFTDWGRDTAIALPGLCICRGLLDEAASIIEHFFDHMKDGLIPNLFPEVGDEPNYNTFDGTLWMVDAAFRLHQAKQGGFVTGSNWEKIKEIVEHHLAGTRNNIHVDEDGLLAGGTEGSQLTWMDVKVDGHVPTPRHGKPVEIQGLWYNALCLAEARAKELGESDFAENCAGAKTKCREAFHTRFFKDDHVYPADVVDRDEPNNCDWAIRPNATLAFGLLNNIYEEERRAEILRTAAEKLVTPRGLRSLDPDHPSYKPLYRGDVKVRDRAYHQGTVWMWLIFPYFKGVIAEADRVPELADGLKVILAGLIENFFTEGCVYQANEVFDGDAPHVPGGCFGQAWSVAAIIECCIAYEKWRPLKKS